MRELTLAEGAAGTTPEFEFAQSMAAFPPATHDALLLDDLLTPEERDVRQRVRRFAVRGAGVAGAACRAAPARISASA